MSQEIIYRCDCRYGTSTDKQCPWKSEQPMPVKIMVTIYPPGSISMEQKYLEFANREHLIDWLKHFDGSFSDRGRDAEAAFRLPVPEEEGGKQ